MRRRSADPARSSRRTTRSRRASALRRRPCDASGPRGSGSRVPASGRRARFPSPGRRGTGSPRPGPASRRRARPGA
ncbi:hypothetical protein D4R89_10210 [bacterium]|nr:MAG: hypothetical protein D4R89_10210 [bacterium]